MKKTYQKDKYKEDVREVLRTHREEKKAELKRLLSVLDEGRRW